MENRNGNGNGNGNLNLDVGMQGNGLTKIHTNGKGNKKLGDGVCHDDSSLHVRAQTLDELHSLQKKRSAPTTPIDGFQLNPTFSPVLEEDRQRQQLQSIRSNIGSGSRGRSSRINPIIVDDNQATTSFDHIFTSNNLVETQESLSPNNDTNIDQVQSKRSKNKPKRTFNNLGKNCCYCVQTEPSSSSSVHSKSPQPVWRKWVSCFNYESVKDHNDSPKEGLDNFEDEQGLIEEESAREIEALTTSSAPQKDSLLSIRC